MLLYACVHATSDRARQCRYNERRSQRNETTNMSSVLDILALVQNSAFSTWIRESSWAIFAFLIAHTIGMGMIVGTGIAMDLRLLGAAPRLPWSLWPRFAPLIKWALAMTVASGILLVIAYPAKALLNVLFYVKLAILASALLWTRRLALRPESVPSIRASAIACLLLWTAGIGAGKLLEYTHTVLLLQ
jgi:hypothetical protein